MKPVLVQAGDGPAIVWHSEEEYARLLEGVDVEASQLMALPIDVILDMDEGDAGNLGPWTSSSSF